MNASRRPRNMILNMFIPLIHIYLGKTNMDTIATALYSNCLWSSKIHNRTDPAAHHSCAGDHFTFDCICFFLQIFALRFQLRIALLNTNMFDLEKITYLTFSIDHTIDDHQIECCNYIDLLNNCHWNLVIWIHEITLYLQMDTHKKLRRNENEENETQDKHNNE